MTGVETLALVYTDATDADVADNTLDVDAVNVSKITVTGADGDTSNKLGLGTLDTDTTTVDASGYHGIMTVAAGAATATSFTARGDVKHSLTGSSKNDTFTITTATTNADMTINGNGGTDTLSMVLGTGAQDFDSITDVDTINFTASGTVAITTDADADVLDGINEATKVTFAGGNSISTITLGGANDTLTATNTAVLDFSQWAGKLSDATFAKDAFDNGEAGITVQVIGSALADTVSASYDAGTDTTVSLNMQGIETFDIHLEDDAAELRVDMALVTGLTKINVTDTSDERVEFYNLGTGVTIDVTATDTTNTTVEVVLADATGSADAQTFVVAAAGADDNVAIVAADIETLNISSDTANQVDLSLADVSMTAAAARNRVNFTGTNDIELVATGADITTIDASGMGTGGAIVQTGRSATEASTYTGSDGNDTFIMMNAGDVLNGGAGTGDTLDINMTQAVGTAIIDLSAADQIASLNGGANAAVQTGFENVDLAGVTGNGAVITGTSAANTITGSGQVDQIDGGAGDDTINGGAGDDVLTGGAGSDTFVFASTAAANNADTITDFTSGAAGDVLNFDAFLGATAAFLDAGSTTISGAIGATNAGAETTGTSISGKVILVDTTAVADTTALATVISADDDNGNAAAEIDDKLLLTDGQKAVVLLGDVDSTGTGNYLVYYVVGTDTAVDDSETITLVGTLQNVDLDALVAANLF
jgi:Ca2+-binding RTX toxin-like protein